MKSLNIYVASSWRNEIQPLVVAVLRADGHFVYDFRHPRPQDDGFSWSEIDPDWTTWSSAQFRQNLSHPLAARGFHIDFSAMCAADVCVLVMPSGRSAHLEAGWFAGRGRPVVALLAGGEPELMYQLITHLCVNIDEVRGALRNLRNVRAFR